MAAGSWGRAYLVEPQKEVRVNGGSTKVDWTHCELNFLTTFIFVVYILVFIYGVRPAFDDTYLRTQQVVSFYTILGANSIPRAIIHIA